MSEYSLNDNNAVPVRDPDHVDPRGQAALLLTESLLHGLIARRLLSASDALDIVKTATDVQRDTIADMIAPDRAMEGSLDLLVTMHDSLLADLPRG